MSEKSIATASRAETDGGFNSDVQRLGKYVRQLHNDLSGIARGAGEAAQSGMAAVKEGGKNTLEAAKEKRDLATASLRNGIANHPGRSLGIAVGVGILIGLVGPVILRSRRQSPESSS